LKVLHLIGGGDVGGAKTHVITLLSELSKKHDITLISFREGEFAEEARAAGIQVVVSDGNWFQDIRTVIQASEGAQILHCHGARANTMGMVLKSKLKIPVVTTVHSDYRLDYMGRFFANITFGIMNRFALRLMDYYIGVSDAMTQLLIRRKFRPERIFTIYNGMDFSIRQGDDTKAQLCSRLGLDYRDGDLFAGIAARFDPVKDLPTLIRAAELLKDSCPQLRFLVAGDGVQKNLLMKMVAKSGARVEFLGWLPNTQDFFRLLDINLLTSLSETFPYALTEGARMGCATVATAVGGIPLLIDHGINGLLFQPRDYETMARELKELSDNPDLRKTIGEKLRRKAQEKFSVSITVARQEEIYAGILRQTARVKYRRDGVTLCGAYGMDNAGDDAILEAILQEIRQLDPDIPVRVLSRNPLMTRLSVREQTFHTFNLLSFSRAICQSQLYLSGGGNLVQDTTSRRSLWFYLFTIYWAHTLGARVIMYGCGIGPVDIPQNRKLTAKVLNSCVDCITLREDESLEELRCLGVSKPKIYSTADPALTLTPAPDEKVDSLLLSQNMQPDGKYIAFVLRNWPKYEERIKDISQAADYAYETFHLTPVFIPLERKQDIHAAKMASELTKCPHILMQEAGNARVAIGLMGRMQVVVAMRLHALIFAASQGIPVVGISYTDKVDAFLQYLGQNLGVSLEQATFQSLTKLISKAVLDIPNRESRILAIQTLIEKERVNGTVLGEYLFQTKGRTGEGE
jgi:polysaccharide pyruvyl transferase CsaB